MSVGPADNHGPINTENIPYHHNIYYFYYQVMNNIIDKTKKDTGKKESRNQQPIREDTKSSIKKSLSIEPTNIESIESLPIDQKIGKVLLGLNQIIGIFGTMIKGQIDGVQSTNELTKSIDALTKSMNIFTESMNEKIWSMEASLSEKITTKILNVQKNNQKILSNQKAIAEWVRVLILSSIDSSTMYNNGRSRIRDNLREIQN